MKRYVLILSVVFACACTKTSLPEEPLAPVNPTERFSFSTLGASKTAIADWQAGKIVWSEGDAVSVFDNTASCKGHEFTSSIDAEDQTKAYFSGELCLLSTEFYALYPYNSASVLSNGRISASIPSLQNVEAGTFANGSVLAFAKGTRAPGEEEASQAISFDNLCAVLSFKLPTYVDDASSVVITSNSSSSLSGTVSVSCKDGSLQMVEGCSSVSLKSDFKAGEQYFASIAPVLCEGGFTLVINCKSGLSYSCRTTKTLDAKAGNIYFLGTTGLVLNITPKVSIAHSHDASGCLDGSVATLEMSGLDELASSKVKSWTIQLINGSGTVVRTSSSPSGTMSVAGSYLYIPQGQYKVQASYTLLDGKTRQVTATAASPAPSFSVQTSGYTSYDLYAGTNGQTRSTSAANACDPSTIYSVTCSVNVAEILLSDTKYSSQFSYSFDGGSSIGISGNHVNVGNKDAMTWAAHTLKCSCVFDGVSASASRTFHVTGLPHYAAPPTNTGSNAWHDMEGRITWGGSYVNMIYSAAKYPRIGSPTFHIPANLSVKVSPYIVRAGWYKTSGNYDLWISLNSDDHVIKSVGMNKGDIFQSDFTATMSPSLNVWRIQFRYTATGVETQVHKFNILYN